MGILAAALAVSFVPGTFAADNANAAEVAPRRCCFSFGSCQPSAPHILQTKQAESDCKVPWAVSDCCNYDGCNAQRCNTSFLSRYRCRKCLEPMCSQHKEKAYFLNDKTRCGKSSSKYSICLNCHNEAVPESQKKFPEISSRPAHQEGLFSRISRHSQQIQPASASMEQKSTDCPLHREPSQPSSYDLNF